MSNEFNFFRTTMPAIRKADYCIGCLNSSVFMDFDLIDENLISLQRISFDGYGCCHLDEKGIPMNSTHSNDFIKQMKNANLDQEVILNLIQDLIHINKDYIWNDALIEYGFLDS